MNGTDYSEESSGLSRTLHFLEGFRGAVDVPHGSTRPWLRCLAIAGSSFLVSVGYVARYKWAKDPLPGVLFKDVPLGIAGATGAVHDASSVVAGQ